MSEITFSTTAEIGIAALARAVSAVFQSVPYEHEPFPPPTPEFFTDGFRVHNVDLGHSVVARDAGGQIVGIAVLARRGEWAYCADFGVVPEFRRRGIGQGLMEAFLEETRRTGARTVELAADAGKTANPAVRLYESAGFRTVRKLVSLRGNAAELAPGPVSADVRPCDVGVLLDWYGGDRSPQPMWERELPSLLAEAEARALLAVRDGGERAFLLYAWRPALGMTELLHLGLTAEAVAEDVRPLLAAAGAGAPTDSLLDQGQPIGSRWHHLLVAAGLRETETILDMARGL
jgi:ribosomal protein S18 acetylase RimI-like enzyme